jgi:predicted nucleotidyltransferase
MGIWLHHRDEAHSSSVDLVTRKSLKPQIRRVVEQEAMRVA